MDLKLSPFSIKDLMLGEILCQALIISEHQFLEVTQLARQFDITFGAALVRLGILGRQDLFHARRLLNQYLKQPEKLEEFLRIMQANVNRSTVPRKLSA